MLEILNQGYFPGADSPTFGASWELKVRPETEKWMRIIQDIGSEGP